MRHRTRRQLGVLGALLLAVGLALLNYTNGPSYEHHRAWSAGKGLPPPSGTLFYLGALFTAAGAGSLGFIFGSSGKATRHR